MSSSGELNLDWNGCPHGFNVFFPECFIVITRIFLCLHREWDLWGPLVICLTLAIILSLDVSFLHHCLFCKRVTWMYMANAHISHDLSSHLLRKAFKFSRWSSPWSRSAV